MKNWEILFTISDTTVKVCVMSEHMESTAVNAVIADGVSIFTPDGDIEAFIQRAD